MAETLCDVEDHVWTYLGAPHLVVIGTVYVWRCGRCNALGVDPEPILPRRVRYVPEGVPPYDAKGPRRAVPLR